MLRASVSSTCVGPTHTRKENHIDRGRSEFSNLIVRGSLLLSMPTGTTCANYSPNSATTRPPDCRNRASLFLWIYPVQVRSAGRTSPADLLESQPAQLDAVGPQGRRPGKEFVPERPG